MSDDFGDVAGLFSSSSFEADSEDNNANEIDLWSDDEEEGERGERLERSVPRIPWDGTILASVFDTDDNPSNWANQS